ncbi:MAG TPA: class I SAM-dependent methyltransferase [Gammaproteobacteria bacterium]|nr:class I SAM-dependent methyltransferase [Gammaproteobacteria bacterium]
MQKLPRTIASRTRALSRLLRKTFLHPQWIALRHDEETLRTLCPNLKGTVADIGCADAKPKKFLGPQADYIGIDYYATSTEWYKTQPDVFADAQALPLKDQSLDHTLLLDVLEHLPEPDRCLDEIHRVLKPGGSLAIQVPFHYPLHDVPLDFHRWTRFGLLEAASRHGFSVKEETALGHPLESAALSANIALSKTVLNWIAQKHVLSISLLLLPVLIPVINLLAWTGARLSKEDDMMPFGYRMIWIKNP